MPDYILIVEDDKGIRQLINTILSQVGYQVLEAADGRTAMTLATQCPPRLILLDMHLPRMNGHEFLRQLPTVTSGRIPVVIITVDRQVRYSQDVRMVAGVLIKPFTVDELLAVVRKYLS